MGIAQMFFKWVPPSTLMIAQIIYIIIQEKSMESAIRHSIIAAVLVFASKLAFILITEGCSHVDLPPIDHLFDDMEDDEFIERDCRRG
jgi:hypothetical protein